MEPTLGQIQLFGFNFAQEGWAKCSGQVMKVTDNPALFSLLGDKYGGDGRTTFALPKLDDASPVNGMSYWIAIDGAYPTRD